MSDQREREKRKQERGRAETRVSAEDRRARLLQFAAGAGFLVLAAVIVAIVIGTSSSSGGDAENLQDVGAVNSLLQGLPQENLALGGPQAPVELIEFGDLQCPFCKGVSEEILPGVIENEIAQGKAKLVFRNFTIIGPQSTPAGAAALAAGLQGRGWNYVELFYRNQGTENSGYADDEFLTAIAKGAGVKDIARWNRDRKSAKLIGEVKKTSEEAQRLGFSGTPSFAIEGPGSKGLETIGTPASSGDLEAAIERAS